MKKEEFKALPLHRKITHCFWHVLLAVCLITIVGTWIKQDYIDPKILLGVEMINAKAETPEQEAFEPFLQKEGYRCQKEQVKVSKLFQLDGPNAMQCDPHMMLFCTLASEKTDIFFWDGQELEAELTHKALTDLREVLPAEILEKYKDDLIYSGLQIQGGFPCGIYLRDNPWIQENGYYEKCAVGIARDAKNADLAGAFLRYILQ